MRRYDNRVPMTGSGRRFGRAEVKRCESSRRVHEGQVYICRWGGSAPVEEAEGNSSSLSTLGCLDYGRGTQLKLVG